MEFTAIVQIYYPERRKYLYPIVDTIQQANPKEIIVWDNGGQLADIGGAALRSIENVTIISSDRNTLLGRYAAIFVAETDLCYVQDDDLIVEPETITRLVNAVTEQPVGVMGSCLNRESHNPYTDGHAASDPCDVVLGRAFACRRQNMAHGINVAMTTGMYPGRNDDIFFSLVGGGGQVLPDAHYTNLDEEGVGLSHEAQHFDERNQFSRKMILAGY